MGYYFSYTYDLTLSKIKRATNCQTETRFQWNYHLHKDLKKFGVDKRWQLSLIQGHIGYATSFIQGKKLEYFLISRRSCFKAGTRYNARGIKLYSIINLKVLTMMVTWPTLSKVSRLFTTTDTVALIFKLEEVFQFTSNKEV
jgi:SacI homology domain